MQAGVYVQQRLPKYWKDGAMFRPERWLEGGSRPAPGTYMPFMIGPRSCVGKKLGLMVVRVVLCKLFSELQFSDVSDIEVVQGLALTPKEVLVKVSQITERENVLTSKNQAFVQLNTSSKYFK